MCKDDWRPGGAGDWSGKSVARDGAAPGPPVLGLRPLLGHSSAFQATTGPSGGHTRTKAGQLEAIWPTWNRGWRIQQARRRQLTLSLRTSPTQGWASKPTRMGSSTQLSLDESLLVTSGISQTLFALSLILIISFVLITNHFSLEMSVSFQARADDVFQTLDYPSKKKKGVGSISTFSFFTPQIC